MLRKFEDDSRVTACQNEISAIPTPAPSSTDAASSPRTFGASVAKRRWVRHGAAVALVLGLAACGGGSDDPPVAEAPPVGPPAEVPGPVPVPVPVPADPTPAGFTKAGEVTSDGTTDVGDRYVSNANPARIVVYDATAAKYSELVTLVAPITWDVARAAAQAAGGDLASPSTAAKLLFIKQAYVADVDLPMAGAASGTNGAWVGLTQGVDAVAADEGWTFLDTTALTLASPYWNGGEPNGGGGANQGGTENVAAIFYGMTAAATDLAMIYDAGQTGATDTQPKYLIEYATKEAVKP